MDSVCVTNCTNSEERPKPEQYVQPVFTVVRDISVENVTMDQIEHNNLDLDSDIFTGSEESDEDKKELCQNRDRFITNFDFSNADEVNQYLRYWGKIPQFLEVRKTKNKGYGVFTLKDIIPNTPLGVYLGIPRLNTNGMQPNNDYLFNLKNFSGECEGIVDAENLTYANYTRFINHKEEPNCDAAIVPLMVTITSIDYIPAGTELSINYGKLYWEKDPSQIKE